MTEHTQQLEALLFLAGEAISKADAARALGCTSEEVQHALTELAASLEDRGLVLTETASHMQLVTSPAVADFVQEYVEHDALELSAAAMETLAIIAYRGPISRPEVDAIRGVDSRRMMRQLIARGLVVKAGKSGHSALYEITPEFLQRLGITRVEELPRWDELSSTEALEQLLSRLKHSA